MTQNIDWSRRGSALVSSLIVVTIIAALTSSMLMVNIAHKREVAAIGNRTRAIYLAEAGVHQSLLELATAIEQGTALPTDSGTVDAPRRLSGGRYWSDITDNADGTFTVISTGTANLARRRVRAEISLVQSVFDHAIFAGNTSEDPTYTLGLGGTGAQADQVIGNVFSAGDITINGDASVSGDLLAGGTISGAAGTENTSRALPDIAGMNYEVNNDFDVASLFAGSSWQSNPLGGSAWQLPESSPAHIFRKNPDDRTDETSSSAKDDYFLEDPYMAVEDFTVPETGKRGHTISLSGTMGHPGPIGSEKVYYIDGNLWVHNKPFGRLRFMNTGPEGAKVTFVVKGNIYFSDDVYIEDEATDGVAFIAIEDAAQPDSGNIYLGDPRYGTLGRMEAFMYAENNFYDNNLDEDGSSTVTIAGNMTAGNQVDIRRDFVRSDGTVVHSKLEVDFDDRLSTGAIELPGLPKPKGGIEGFDVVFWQETAVD